MLQAVSKGSSGQGMGNLKRFWRGDLTKVRNKSEVIDEARMKSIKVLFSIIYGHVI